MGIMTTTYDPAKSGRELQAGRLYVRILPDGSEEQFSVLSKKRLPNGMCEYLIMSVTFGRSILKDTAEGYKQLVNGCRLWDVERQEAADIPEPEAVPVATKRSGSYALDI